MKPGALPLPSGRLVAAGCLLSPFFLWFSPASAQVEDIPDTPRLRWEYFFEQRAYPFGEIPVLEDGKVVLRDSQAILVYLARKYGGETWLPTNAVDMAHVVSWLMVAENEIARGPNDARLHDKFGFPIDVDKARQIAARILGLLDARLSQADWLAGDRVTIADIACMPYVALGHEGGISLDAYAAICAWIGRIRALPGFIAMPELHGES